MKKTLIILTAVLSAILALLVFMPMGVSAEVVDSGSYGENITWSLDNEGMLTIRGTGDMKDISYYSASPWYSNDSIKNVKIEEGITSISSYAFRSCSALTSISIPDTVTKIGSDAFYYCSSLSFVDITDLDAWCQINFKNSNSNPLSNGAVLYLNNQKVTKVNFCEGITAVAPYIFNGYGDLTEVTIPKGVTAIGAGAFYDCENLENVELPESLISIGKEAFGYCDALTSISIPNGVTSISNGAFKSCSLVNIDLPNNLITIGPSAFSSCQSLKSVSLGNNLESVGSDAFAWCFNLAGVHISDIKAWFKISFDNNMANPLYNADNLYLNGNLVEELHIPDGATLNSYAFIGWDGIKSVLIPKSITSIPQNVFYLCDNITEVYYAGTAEEWESVRIASGNDSLESATLYTDYVADGFKVTYKSGTSDTVTNMPASSTAYGSYMVTSTVPVRDGYKFIGWSTKEGSSTAQYKSGDVISIYSDTTLYAVWGQTDKYQINGISLSDSSYNAISAIPDTSFIAEVSVTNNSAEDSATIFIASYDKNGKMLDFQYMYANFEIGQTASFGTKIDNTSANVTKVKAFVVSDLKTFNAMCEAVEIKK